MAFVFALQAFHVSNKNIYENPNQINIIYI